MMRQLAGFLVSCAVCAAVSVSAWAHHSASMFDQTQTLDVTATTPSAGRASAPGC